MQQVAAPMHAHAPQRGALAINPVRVRHDMRHAGVSPLCVVDFDREQEFGKKITSMAEDAGSAAHGRRPGSIGLTAGVYRESWAYSATRNMFAKAADDGPEPGVYLQRTEWGGDGEPECPQAVRCFPNNCDDHDGAWACALQATVAGA